MAFFLFIFVTGTLFIRPAEMIPDLIGVSVYEYSILTCLLLAVPEIIKFVTSARPDRQPVTLCVLGVFLAAVISQIAISKFDDAGEAAFYVFKILVYYVLLISLVNTPRRLRTFLFFLLCFCLVLTLLMVLNYYEVIELANVKARLVDRHYDSFSGEETKFDRLVGTGIFQDPNEFCLMLSVAIPLCLYQMRSMMGKLIWLAPLGLLLFTVMLTQSRGGLLAVGAGVGVIIWTKFGWKKAVALACLGLPLALVLFAGRQTAISATDTGQQRIQLWSDWLDKFRGQPVFGAGMKIPELFDPNRQEMRQALREDKLLAAHNSYLHAFGELGFFGGMFFLGAFFFALWGLYRLGNAEILDRSMKDAYPFAAGAFCAYSVGMLTLSVCYTVPTYLMLGLASIVYRVTPHRSTAAAPRFDMSALVRLAGLSVVYIAAIYVFVRIFVRWA